MDNLPCVSCQARVIILTAYSSAGKNMSKSLQTFTLVSLLSLILILGVARASLAQPPAPPSPGTASQTPSLVAQKYFLSGSFSRTFTDAQSQKLAEALKEHFGLKLVLRESFPPQFRLPAVGGFSLATCRKVRSFLLQQPYLTVSNCQVLRSLSNPEAPVQSPSLQPNVSKIQAQPPLQQNDQAVTDKVKARELHARDYQEKLENLRRCGPRPGAPGNWVCKEGKWQLLKPGEVGPKPAPAVTSTRALELRRLHHERLQARYQALQQNIQARRQARLEQLQTKQEAFKQKIKEKLGEKQQEIAERVANRINQVNQRLTDHYLKFLERLETVLLEKIEARTTEIEDQFGADLSSIHNAIAEAKAKIDEAVAAVQEQAAQVYVVEIQEGEKVGQAIRRTVLQMHEDHRQLRQNYLRPAKQAVIDVFKTLRQEVLNRKQNILEQTPTPQPQP